MDIWSNKTIEPNGYFSKTIFPTVNGYLALAIRTEWHFWCAGSQMTLCKCTWFSKTIELYCFSHKITEHCRRKQSLLPSQSLLFGPISVERTKYVTNIPTTYTLIPRKLRPCKLRFCKLRSNFYFIRDFPQSLHIFNLASCVLLVAVTVYFPPKVPQLARFMCSFGKMEFKSFSRWFFELEMISRYFLFDYPLLFCHLQQKLSRVTLLRKRKEIRSR